MKTVLISEWVIKEFYELSEILQQAWKGARSCFYFEKKDRGDITKSCIEEKLISKKEIGPLEDKGCSLYCKITPLGEEKLLELLKIWRSKLLDGIAEVRRGNEKVTDLYDDDINALSQRLLKRENQKI